MFKLCEATFGIDGLEFTSLISEHDTLDQANNAGQSMMQEYGKFGLTLLIEVPEEDRGEEEYPNQNRYIMI